MRALSFSLLFSPGHFEVCMLSSEYLLSETVTKQARFLNISPWFLIYNSIKSVHNIEYQYKSNQYVFTLFLKTCRCLDWSFNLVHETFPMVLWSAALSTSGIWSRKSHRHWLTESITLTGVRTFTNSLRIYLQNAYIRLPRL